MAPTKRKYPNIPADFRILVREARVNKGLSMRAVAKDLDIVFASVGQLELGRRNFNYETAIKFRDYYQMDYALPIPLPDEADPLTRNRKKKPIESGRGDFYILVDGEILEVLTFRRIGPVTPYTYVTEVKE